MDKVLSDLIRNEEFPNAEQLRLLQAFVNRLKLELLENLQHRVGASKEEPLLDVIHGYPGTGKSKLIEWMRKLMEVGLGWEHGIQFVCLACQNSMAARTNGFTFTVHYWSGIPARQVEGNGTWG